MYLRQEGNALLLMGDDDRELSRREVDPTGNFWEDNPEKKKDAEGGAGEKQQLDPVVIYHALSPDCKTVVCCVEENFVLWNVSRAREWRLMFRMFSVSKTYKHVLFLSDDLVLVNCSRKLYILSVIEITRAQRDRKPIDFMWVDGLSNVADVTVNEGAEMVTIDQQFD